MFPHERSLVQKLQNKPFVLLGVNSDSNRDELKPVLAKEKITWRSWWNGPDGTAGPIAKAYNVSGWPSIFVLDQEGVIRHKWEGSPGEQVLDKAIDDLIEKAEGEKVSFLSK
jgi:hypothetical protein